MYDTVTTASDSLIVILPDVNRGPHDANSASAAGPALGFTCQIETALLLLLTREASEDVVTLSLETADDIVVEKCSGVDSIQVKHSVDQEKRLTDYSSDLWKTIGNWIASGDQHRRYTLVTTYLAPDDSAASALRSNGREPPVAAQRLEDAASKSTSVDNAPHFASFLNLTHPQRIAFLERVYVLDGSTGADGMASALEFSVRTAVRSQHRQPLVQRLRGWWITRAQEHLLCIARGERDVLSSEEVEAQIADLVQEFRDSRLPIDILDIPRPASDEAHSDDRLFVDQLREIEAGDRRLRLSIYDHNRAAAQRSVWQREKLLNVGELGRFDLRLADEWERYFLWVDEEEFDDEEAACARARQTFDEMQRAALPKIRSEVEEKFVATGSLHMLADRLQIGWHPLWTQRFLGREEEAGKDDRKDRE